MHERVALIRTLTGQVVPVPGVPPQFADRDPVAGQADRVTQVPWAKPELQFDLQAMPPGALETVPLPDPALVTVSGVGASPENVTAQGRSLAPKVGVTVGLVPEPHARPEARALQPESGFNAPLANPTRPKR